MMRTVSCLGTLIESFQLRYGSGTPLRSSTWKWKPCRWNGWSMPTRFSISQISVVPRRPWKSTRSMSIALPLISPWVSTTSRVAIACAVSSAGRESRHHLAVDEQDVAFTSVLHVPLTLRRVLFREIDRAIRPEAVVGEDHQLLGDASRQRVVGGPDDDRPVQTLRDLVARAAI